MTLKTSMDKLLAVVQENRKQGTGCAILAGSGISVKGGIPTGSGFLKILKHSFPKAYEKAAAKTYHQCMAELPPADQKKVFAKIMESIRLNWANVCIALLLKKGFVDRVFTTNFDPLLRRACALLGEFPSVYDPTLAQVLKHEPLGGKSIFCLHGQTPWFSVSRIKEKTQSYWESVGAYLKETAQKRPFIVVGYGGANDPVFDQLLKVGKFEKGLYWSSHLNAPPPKHVREGLLTEGRRAGIITGYDADTFLVTLAQKLGVLPPELMARPFSHLDQMIRDMAPFPLAGQGEDLDVTNATRILMQIAMTELEPGETPGGADKTLPESVAKAKEAPELLRAIIDAQGSLMAGDLDTVMDHRAQFDKTPSPQLGEILSWAHMIRGKTQFDDAGTQKEREKRLQKLEAAAKEYKAALAINPEMHQAFYRWGLCLVELARNKPADESESLLAQAGEKFQKTIQINPDLPEAYYGWGYVLSERGKSKKTEDKAAPFFTQAIEKFQAALAQNSDMYPAYYGWGHALLAHGRKMFGQAAATQFEKAIDIFKCALEINPDYADAIYQVGQGYLEQSRLKSGKEADTLLLKAADQFQQVLRLDPDRDEALYGWACVLFERGKTQPGDVAETLFKEAREKLSSAVAINPNDPQVLCTLGSIFTTLAGLKRGEEAAALLGLASKKFQEALKIQPEYHEAVNQLGVTLLQLAQSKQGKEAKPLLQEAVGHFKNSVKLQPENYNALTQWGNALLQLAVLEPEKEDALAAEAGEKLQTAVKIKPDGHEALNQLGNVLMRRSRKAGGEEARALFNEAVEKYKAAVAIQPKYPQGLAHWGDSLLQMAKKQTGPEAEKLFNQALEKYEAALKIKDDLLGALINYGLVLMEVAKTKKGINAHPLYAEARKKFQKAEDLKPGSAAFNMALLMAKLANETGCKEWLERSKEFNVLPGKEALLKNPLLESVRDSKWFKLLLYEAFIEQTPENAKKE